MAGAVLFQLAMISASASETTFVGPVTVDADYDTNFSDLTLTGSGFSNFNGIISGFGNVTKSGDGAWLLNAANDFYGPTSIVSGALILGHTNALQNSTLNYVEGGGVLYSGAGGSTITLGGLAGNKDFAMTTGTTLALGANDESTTYAGQLSGVGLIKTGAGTLTLTGANTNLYSTVINSGKIQLAGTTSALGPGVVVVQAGGTLGGSGTFAGDLVLNGGLAPGNSIGELRSGNAIWNAGSYYQWDINTVFGPSGAPNGVGWDLWQVDGTFTINAAPHLPVVLQLRSFNLADEAGMVEDFDPFADYSFPFITAIGGISGFNVASVVIDASQFENASSGIWSVAQDENVLMLRYDGPAVSTPDSGATAALLLLALTGLAGYRTRRPAGVRPERSPLR